MTHPKFPPKCYGVSWKYGRLEKTITLHNGVSSKRVIHLFALRCDAMAMAIFVFLISRWGGQPNKFKLYSARSHNFSGKGSLTHNKLVVDKICHLNLNIFNCSRAKQKEKDYGIVYMRRRTNLVNQTNMNIICC